jgi:predicted ArsR family transcriptional regulator
MSKLFAVLSDDYRRLLLARLRERQPLSLSELAEGLEITRQAVTKHLDQLHRAGLLTVERRGRERLHWLRPEPLQEIEAWLAPYAAAWDRRLERLGRHLEEDREDTPGANAPPETNSPRKGS